MTLKEEVAFYIQASINADKAGTAEGFEKRLNTLFLEGQITEQAYKLLRQILGYAVEAPKVESVIKMTPAATVVKRTTTVVEDPCSRSFGFGIRGGC